MKINNLASWWRFLRSPNLIIVVLTQYFVRWYLLEPFANATRTNLIFNDWEYFVFTLNMLLMTAGGYIINDYYDFEIDKINKPEKVFIGKILSKKGAWWLYWCVNGLGFLLTIYLYLAVEGLFAWAFAIAFVMNGAMWWYSKQLKRTAFWGNLTVSLFCAAVPLVACLPELDAMGGYAVVGMNPITARLGWVTWGYIAFAFISTLYRELIKDLEDCDGDFRGGCRTLPIVRGEGFAKMIATAIGLVFFGFASVVLITENWVTKVYFSMLVIVPLLYSLLKLQEANEKVSYHQQSTIAKVLMLNGLLYLAVFHYFG